MGRNTRELRGYKANKVIVVFIILVFSNSTFSWCKAHYRPQDSDRPKLMTSSDVSQEHITTQKIPKLEGILHRQMNHNMQALTHTKGNLPPKSAQTKGLLTQSERKRFTQGYAERVTHQRWSEGSLNPRKSLWVEEATEPTPPRSLSSLAGLLYSPVEWALRSFSSAGGKAKTKAGRCGPGDTK